MNQLIGIFGGTFNPVHVGHLRAAEEVAEILSLARVLFVPASDPPLKRDGDVALAPASDRFRWVESAIAGNPHFETSDVELSRSGPSYLVDTLQLLRSELAPAELVFILGEDAFAQLDAWRAPELLPTLAHFAVVTRPPGSAGHSLADWLPACLTGSVEVDSDGQLARHRTAGHWIRRVPISGFDVSATDIRGRVRDCRSIRYLVPEIAREPIEKCNAYRGQPT
ncbi:MAG: nicotinate (nicotinamide) nucleotide adenylyltransferase [bacterium]|nr:nicotinate (nicotinamide) nucleotide adenylyltransferase [bacterium]MCP5069117.1 nicotinate (nicotinamide) nucleotide adenylyltransferase [bacterium]